MLKKNSLSNAVCSICDERKCICAKRHGKPVKVETHPNLEMDVVHQIIVGIKFSFPEVVPDLKGVKV